MKTYQNFMKKISLENNKQFNKKILENLGFMFILTNYISECSTEFDFKKEFIDIITRNCTLRGNLFKIREIRMCQNILEYKREDEDVLVITGETHLDNIEEILMNYTNENIKSKSLVCKNIR